MEVRVAARGGPATPVASGLSLLVTADDAYTVYLDGQPIGGDSRWQSGDTYALNVSPGPHVLAVRAEDQHAVIAGFRAALYREGQIIARTGDGVFVAMPNPPVGFEQPGFDDSGWPLAQVCSDTRPWGGQPANLEATGAAWVWGRDCGSLGVTGFRMGFES
ncbi:MAG: hypothetical protein AB8I08_36415 [Sandaracinaceae bacterium]